ncbi:CHRNA7-FAM7A fusion protein [Aplysia californica]|uniref:CHRNA7-FAM7A fusion protein n=1 Tax=Aplysia californica TaxID=6500 RepID=A0ABM0K7X0_APLCA|nr:CHRNA7-FAM7A fusion protein [Aplysia californica]
MKLEPVSLCNMTANGEYEVTYEGYSLHPISYRFTEETYDWASFTIKLSRRSSYVGISLVLPVILISLLSPVAYLLHPGDTNKFPVAVSTLLSFTVFLQVLDSNLPDTSDNLGLLAVYVSAMLTLGFLSALGNCIVSVLESDFKNARALGITPSLMPSTQPPETTLEKREGLNQPKPASGREETSSFEKEKDLQKCQDRNFLCLRLPCNEWTATIIRVSGFSGKSPAQKLNNAFLLVHIFIFIICTTVLGAMMLCE